MLGAGFVSLKVVRFKGVGPYQEFAFGGKIAETEGWRDTWGRKRILLDIPWAGVLFH